MEMKPRLSFEWDVTDLCNFKCPYCSYTKIVAHKGHCSDEIIRKVFELMDSLEGSWLVKLIGGEPLIHPRFLDMCQKVADCGHTLAVNTNFSLPLKKIHTLVETCRQSLAGLIISVHESQIKDIKAFVEKIGIFSNIKNDATNLAVTAVVTKENFDKLLVISDMLAKYGLQLDFQVMRQNGKYVRYPEHIEKRIRSRTIENLETIRGSNFRGCYCYTGMYFFRIRLNGDVSRCFNYQPNYHLGNIISGSFKPFSKPVPCLSPRCTCTLPANRNMICFDRKCSKVACYLYWFPVGLMRNLSWCMDHGVGFIRKKIRRFSQ